MPATPLRFDHLALPAYDAARTLHFYAEVLQLPLVDALSGDDSGGKPWLMMFFGTGGGAAAGIERAVRRAATAAGRAAGRMCGITHSRCPRAPSSVDLQPDAPAAQRVQDWIDRLCGGNATDEE